MKKILCFTLLLFALSLTSRAQDVALKTNLLYGIGTLTPNLGAEVALSHKLSLDFNLGVNPWKANSDEVNVKKLTHYLAQMELRYWTCRKFSGLFFGVHGLGGLYNISGHNFFFVPTKDNLKNYRYDGYAYGAGVSVGYQFVLARRWNLELNLGGGYAHMHYNLYDGVKCGKKLASDQDHDYWGLTRAGVSIMFLF